MTRSDHSRSHGDSRRRPPSGLSLSTGRLEGRPRNAADARRTRHNPLRDDDRSASRRPRRTDEAAPSTRHSGRGRSARRDPFDAPSYRDDFDAPPPRRGGSSVARGPQVGSSLADSLVSLMPTMKRSSGHGGSFHRGIDLRTLGLALIALALAVVLVMAVAHVGPFATPKMEDHTSHVGALSARAATNNGVYIAQGIATQISLARPIEPDLALMPAHEVTREDIGALGGQKEPFAFAMNASEGEGGASTPVLSDQSLVQLNNALTYYETNGYDVGYLLMDLGTGRGIAGNLDSSIYGASSFKGPFCTYIAEKEMSSDIDKVKSTRREQIENTIIWSDNTSYSKLRRLFGTDGMEEWLGEAGVATSLVDDTSFPHYTARQSALMWLKIYHYLTDSDSSTAQWLSDTFAKTEVSFLRNGALGTTSAGHIDWLPSEDSGQEEALEEAEVDSGEELASDEGDTAQTDAAGAADGEGEAEAVDPVAAAIAEDAADGRDATVMSIGANITVRNKAGWINGDKVDAVCDSGIVTINDRDYLMVIMTGAPDTAESEQAFAHLARTLLEIRIDLV